MIGLCLRGTKGHDMCLRGTKGHGLCLGGTKSTVCVSEEPKGMVCVSEEPKGMVYVLGDQMIGLCPPWDTDQSFGLCLRGTKGHGMCLGGPKGMVCLSGTKWYVLTFHSVHLSEFVRTFCFV